MKLAWWRLGLRKQFTIIASVGVTLLSLRTRASLEERYLDIVSDDQGTAEP